jgi:hypothetical protein
MIYRGLYHFYVVRQKGLASDPVKYFAASENQDLGIVKQRRKPNLKLIVAPFPERQRSPNDLDSLLLKDQGFHLRRSNLNVIGGDKLNFKSGC